jgi:hypothetical protein
MTEELAIGVGRTAAFESRRENRLLFAGRVKTSTLARRDCHERADRLMLRSGTPGVGE